MSILSAGLAAWRLSYQLSPIILNNGIANSIPFKMLPIIAITESINFAEGILTGGDDISLDNFFANFVVLPGDTLIDQQIGKYPFANQAVAANAVIAQPLKVSLLMICPVKNAAGYAGKLAIMMALQAALKSHNATGGTYTVITPCGFYTDCLMTGLTDVSSSESRQPQNAWRWDFEQPLLTQSAATSAAAALNSKMSAITNGLQADGSLSGAGGALSTNIAAGVSTVIPSASGAVSGMTAIGQGLFVSL